MASAERWKRQERAVAAALGTTRLPNSGRGQPDCRCRGPSGRWAVQVKTRAELPAWLRSAVEQAERDAGGGEAPAVVLCEVRRGVKARRLVVLAFEDWQRLAGAPTAPEEERR